MIGPDELINHAKQLIMQENNPQEVEFRSAISRAYYAVYHEARIGMFTKYKKDMSDEICQHLDKRNRSYDKSKIEALDLDYIRKQRINLHEAISNTLMGIGEKRTSDQFRLFRVYRNRADYDIHEQYSNKSARKRVKKMEKLVLEIRRF